MASIPDWALSATQLSLSVERERDLLPQFPKFSRLQSLTLELFEFSARDFCANLPVVAPKLHSLSIWVSEDTDLNVLRGATALTRLVMFVRDRGTLVDSHVLPSLAFPHLRSLLWQVESRAVASLKGLLQFIRRHPRISYLDLYFGRKWRGCGTAVTEKKFERALQEVIDYADSVCMEHVVFTRSESIPVIERAVVNAREEKHWTHVVHKEPL